MRAPIVEPPRNAWAVAAAEGAGLLVDAHDYYQAFYRAALGARRYLLLSGWQFDSKVELLRGERRALAAQGGGHTRLLPFLNHLCETRPDRQAENVGRLRRVAAETGHALGVYYTVARGPGPDGAEVRTYVHTKLTLVDDDSLSVGSANLINRSMGLDTELNVSWDAARHEAPAALRRAIRRPRVSLLAEHSGLAGAAVRALVPIAGLVDRLDALAVLPHARLRLHPSPTRAEAEALALVDPQQLPFDDPHPDGAPEEETEEDRPLFRGALASLLPGLR